MSLTKKNYRYKAQIERLHNLCQRVTVGEPVPALAPRASSVASRESPLAPASSVQCPDSAAEMELVRIRHVPTGRYMFLQPHPVRTGSNLRSVFGLEIGWCKSSQDAPSWPRCQAIMLAGAHTTLTGDHDIELEPADDGGAA